MHQPKLGRPALYLGPVDDWAFDQQNLAESSIGQLASWEQGDLAKAGSEQEQEWRRSLRPQGRDQYSSTGIEEVKDVRRQKRRCIHRRPVEADSVTLEVGYVRVEP